MFQITGIDHIVLTTQNTQRMINFYCEILGCIIEKVQPQYSLTQLRAGDSLIDFVEDTNYHPVKSKNLKHFCLRITPFDMQELKQYFAENKVEMSRLGEHYSAQGISESFYITDPEGNEIELKKEQHLST